VAASGNPGVSDTKSAAHAPAERSAPWYRRLTGASSRPDSRDAINTEIVAALNDVAGAVASARNVDDVLATIAERAKRITGAEKAAVVLTDETGESLDVDTVVVRGELARHLQDWWIPRLDELCEATFATGDAVMERHEEDQAWLVCSPLRIREQPVGMLAVINSAERPFTDLQVALLAILSAFAASSIESTRLAAHGRSLVLEAERERIARELHDGIVQSLFSVSLGLEACKKQTVRDPEGVVRKLSDIQQELTTAMGELRRFVYDLRPADVRSMGLAGAIRQWIRRVGDQTPARGRLVVVGEARTLSAQEEACLYAVAKEAVSNIVRHAKADHYEVRLEYEVDDVQLTIVDDGQGFDLAGALDRSDAGCLGLLSMRERVDKVEGALTFDTRPGDGTNVTVMLQTGSH
jgi:two-component system sensor histidine kinase DegS